MNIGNITSNNFNLDVIGKDIQIEVYEQLIEQLQQENKQLKERIEYLERSNNRREDTILEQRQEISDLEDNWNYIKKMLKEVRQEKFNVNGYCGTCTDVDIDFLLNKMQELEQGSDSK